MKDEMENSEGILLQKRETRTRLRRVICFRNELRGMDMGTKLLITPATIKGNFCCMNFTERDISFVILSTANPGSDVEPQLRSDSVLTYSLVWSIVHLKANYI